MEFEQREFDFVTAEKLRKKRTKAAQKAWGTRRRREKAKQKAQEKADHERYTRFLRVMKQVRREFKKAKIPKWRRDIAVAARTLDWEKFHATDEQLLAPVSVSGRCEMCGNPSQVSGFGQNIDDYKTRYVELCWSCAPKAGADAILGSNLPGRENWDRAFSEARDTSGRVKPLPDLDAQDRERILDMPAVFHNAMGFTSGFFPHARTGHSKG